jgi:excisionase family DNA binding protein
MQREPKYFTISAVARMLHVSWHWVWRRVRAGEIDAVRLDGRSRYRIPSTSVKPLLQRMQKLHN